VYPTAIGVDNVAHKLYVANFRNNTVSIINATSSTTMENPFPVGRAPTAIGVDPSTNTIYVANHDDNGVSVVGSLLCRYPLDKSSLMASIPINAEP